MRNVFLGSPPFATPILIRLLESAHRPALIVTPPERRRGRGRKVGTSSVAELANEAGVELLQPETVKDAAFLERLAGVEADVFLVASYGELLRQEFLDLPRLACLNVHPSLLPRHRGATPIPAAILAGDDVTGTTIQRMVLALDAGDVLVQKETRVEPGETAGELAQRLAELSGDAALEALEALADGSATFVPQDGARVTVCKKLTKEDGRIDWARPSVEVDRHVRAMNPWPIAQTTLPGGTPLAIWRAHPVPLAAGERGSPGTVLASRGRWIVATGDGALELDEVQMAGKKALSAGDFLRGARLENGTRMGA